MIRHLYELFPENVICKFIHFYSVLFIKHVCRLRFNLFYTLYHTAMKIITSSGSKLLPKPSTGSTAPIVVVTSAGSSAGGTLVSASNTLTASGLSSSQSPSALHRNTVITNPTGMLSLHYHILEFVVMMSYDTFVTYNLNF